MSIYEGVIVKSAASEIEHKKDTISDKEMKKISKARLVGVPPSSKAACAVKGIKIAANNAAKIRRETDTFAKFRGRGRDIYDVKLQKLALILSEN